MHFVRFNSYPLFVIVLLLGVGLLSIQAQTPTSVYYKNFAHHPDGTLCEHIPQVATFTAYLNNDLSKVLIENAPRWDPGDPNIAGNGTFGVELGNFINPPLAVGDSVFGRFTCNETQSQGVLADSVTSIPWFVFPEHLNLSAVNLPSPPQGIQVSVDSATHQRTLTWNTEPGITYSVYRRALEDTIHTGEPRRLYTRIANNLTGGFFTDPSTIDTLTYAYILYATSGQGVTSSHSREVFETDGPRVLTVTPQATTTRLTWSPYTSPVEETKGYNIYRRTENGNYGEPIAYTGLDTTFMDSRLDLNTTYHYKVTARIDQQTELGETPEVSATTLSSSLGFYTYANLKVAVIIYKNTHAGAITNSDIADIKTEIDIAKLFYWRNSKMKLNLEFDYLEIDEYRDFSDTTTLHIQQTASDLVDEGVMNTQYDVIFRIAPGIGGFWSIGVSNLNLPGPSRQTGFSHTQWPLGTGVIYPGHLPGIDYKLTWIFVHEVQHAIDALYNANNHPEMYHGDLPWEFPVACGEHYDFQAKMFRTFTAYEGLLDTWGDIYEAVDSDNDQFPDAEPLVALDEARFSSSDQTSDSDADGYEDREEAIDGSYSGSNPNHLDTDLDGVMDGQDIHPRYPINTEVPRFTPVIDGVVEPDWPLINDTVSYTQQGYSPELYMSYDDDSLYVALYLPHIGLPTLMFDFHGDGWWWSSGNTRMRINVSLGNFAEFRSWDASDTVKTYSLNHGGPGGMWDTDPLYQQVFNRRVINPGTVHLEVNLDFPLIQIEMAIPKRQYAGITLQQGDEIGVNINYDKVNNNVDQWATTFDQYSFVNLTLGGSVGVEDGGREQIVKKFELKQNYPNPFNPTTTIEYALPKQANVELDIFNVMGQQVKSLVNDHQTAGQYEVKWDGRDNLGVRVGSGIYFYTLKAGDFKKTGKMVLVR